MYPKTTMLEEGVTTTLTSIPGSQRNQRTLPFFIERKINKVVNKFSKMFNKLFHGHWDDGSSHSNYNDRGFYNQQRQFRPPPQYYPQNNNFFHQGARDYDRYGSCQYGPCKSVKHALDSYFIRDGFGKVINKFFNHHHH